jgi:hypothetical protein
VNRSSRFSNRSFSVTRFKSTGSFFFFRCGGLDSFEVLGLLQYCYGISLEGIAIGWKKCSVEGV